MCHYHIGSTSDAYIQQKCWFDSRRDVCEQRQWHLSKNPSTCAVWFVFVTRLRNQGKENCHDWWGQCKSVSLIVQDFQLQLCYGAVDFTQWVFLSKAAAWALLAAVEGSRRAQITIHSVLHLSVLLNRHRATRDEYLSSSCINWSEMHPTSHSFCPVVFAVRSNWCSAGNSSQNQSHDWPHAKDTVQRWPVRALWELISEPRMICFISIRLRNSVLQELRASIKGSSLSVLSPFSLSAFP